jgi:hypothetical protein
VGAPALAVRGHGTGPADHHSSSYTSAHPHSEPFAHAAAHEPFAHAVGQPVPVSRNVRAQPVAVGGIADRKRAIRNAVSNIHPALGMSLVLNGWRGYRE